MVSGKAALIWISCTFLISLLRCMFSASVFSIAEAISSTFFDIFPKFSPNVAFSFWLDLFSSFNFVTCFLTVVSSASTEFNFESNFVSRSVLSSSSSSILSSSCLIFLSFHSKLTLSSLFSSISFFTSLSSRKISSSFSSIFVLSDSISSLWRTICGRGSWITFCASSSRPSAIFQVWKSVQRPSNLIDGMHWNPHTNFFLHTTRRRRC